MRTKLLIGTLTLLAGTLIVNGDDVSDAMEMSEAHKEADKCPISEYGAVGDGKTLDTTAIQTALDACGAKEDGGIVEFEGGKTYLSGSLQIPSKVTLLLPKKTVLAASSLPEHYPSSIKDWQLLRIEKATRVSIIGPGQINGQASQWTEKYEGKLELKSWYNEDCMESSCRPGLIGIRESSQITIQDIELKDFVDTAILIERSDATAIIDAHITADLALEGPNGIVVDSGKRVYIGETVIEAPGHAIVAQTSTNVKPLESLLVDGITIKSKTAAIQIGPTIKAEAKTIVMQNIKVLTCKRGISMQLHDSGDIHDVWFTNVTIQATLADDDAYGSGEAIFASVKTEYFGSQLGKMSAIWFGKIYSESEAGLVFSGDPHSVIDGITVKDSTIALTKLSSVSGGLRDFRPATLESEYEEDVPIIFLEYANHVTLNNTKVTFKSPRREEWSDLIQMTPKSVHEIDISGLSMHDSSAHTTETYSPIRKIAQLGDFFKHSMQDVVSAISQKGYISVQENAAFGVSGRKSPGSGGPIVMSTLLLVLIGLGIRYLCIPTWRSLQNKRGS